MMQRTAARLALRRWSLRDHVPAGAWEQGLQGTRNKSQWAVIYTGALSKKDKGGSRPRRSPKRSQAMPFVADETCQGQPYTTLSKSLM
jgi:hypothetical protein